MFLAVMLLKLPPDIVADMPAAHNGHLLMCVWHLLLCCQQACMASSCTHLAAHEHVLVHPTTQLQAPKTGALHD